MSYGAVLGALVALIVIVSGISALFWWVRRPAAYRHGGAHAPLPLFSHSRAAVWVREDGDELDETSSELIAARATHNGHNGGATVPPWSVSSPDVTMPSTRMTAAAPNGSGQVPAATARAGRTSVSALTAQPTAGTSDTGTSHDDALPSVQFSVPADATLPFLPGRLEILSGSEQGRELRFVRLPSDAETRITFGRLPGTPYRHVQLRDATVSHEHAALQLRAGHWRLVNYSATNPLRVNGLVLAVAEEIVLRDGDRVEMGEVTFRFRR